VVFVALLAVTVLPLGAASGWAGVRASPVEVENARAGTGAWDRPQAGVGVDAYSSEVSVTPGGSIHLHVATSPAAPYRIEIYRLGWYGGAGGRLVGCIPDCVGSEQGAEQGVPRPDRATGLLRLGWPVTDVIPVGSDWVSGYYYLDVVLAGGPNAGAVRHVPVIVLASAAEHSEILAQASVNTWQAYNGWGGVSLYSHYGQRNGSHVSFDRPYDLIHQGPASWELSAVHFLERHGYDVSYTTDVDTDRDPKSLLGHALVIVLGHDEYWTNTMRDAFENARDSGVSLAFLGGNIGYWQARYADDRRTLIEYRNSRRDPEPDPALKTTTFRSLRPPRPECQVTGVGYGAIGDSNDYTVTSAALTDRWFRHTGFTPGSTLRTLVGYEWDGIKPGCPASGVTDLFHYDGLHGARALEGSRSNADAVRYTAPSGARVFAAGSLQFPWGLDPLQEHYDRRLDRFMQNALDDLTRPPPPAFATASRTRSGVMITLPAPPAAQPRALIIFRHQGAERFHPSEHNTIRTLPPSCTAFTDQPGRGIYRYAIAYANRWRLSTPTLTPAVHTTRTRRRLTHKPGCAHP
jgi:hypothetical protein